MPDNKCYQTVANSPKNHRFIVRQVVEKDIPFFDRNPEEWPTFATQFCKIIMRVFFRRNYD